jgi:ketosteroid isomerase-like protein
VPSLNEQIPMFDAAFDALERGNVEAFTEITRDQTHPECRFHSGIGSVVGGGEYQGVDGIRSWFQDFIATTSERHWRNRGYETYGDTMLVFLADLEFTGAGSGARVENETGAVFEYEDGLCVRINSFMSHAEARQFAEARVA